MTILMILGKKPNLFITYFLEDLTQPLVWKHFRSTIIFF